MPSFRVSGGPPQIRVETARVHLKADQHIVRVIVGTGPIRIVAQSIAPVRLIRASQGPPGPPGPAGPPGAPGIGLDTSLFREDEQLVGPIDGINKTFVLPYGDKAVVADPGLKIKVYYNGQRLHEGLANDYVTLESGGPGTGYDTIVLNFVAPKPGDIVTADYLKKP